MDWRNGTIGRNGPTLDRCARDYARLNQSRCCGPQLWIQRKRLCQFVHLPPYAAEYLGVLAVVESLRDPCAYLCHLAFFHAPGSKRRSANANAAGLKRRIGVERNSVLVDSNSGLTES